MEPSSSNSNDSQNNDDDEQYLEKSIGITMNSNLITPSPTFTSTTLPTTLLNRVNHPGLVQLPPQTNLLPFNSNNLSPPILNNQQNNNSTFSSSQQPSTSNHNQPLISPVSPSGYSNSSSFEGFNDNQSTTSGRNVRRFPMRNVMYPAKLGSVTGESDLGGGTSTYNDNSTTRGILGDGSLKEASSSSSNTSSLKGESKIKPGLSNSIISEPFLMTKRFEHTVMADGGNWIVTGREGAITTCEEEVSFCIFDLLFFSYFNIEY